MPRRSDPIDPIIEQLEVKANEIFQYFKENAMKVNADKCHLLMTTNEKRYISIGGGGGGERKYKIVKWQVAWGHH